MSKAPEPQAIQKLLHSRKTKNNSSNASVLTASSNNSASSNVSEGSGAKSKETAAGGKKSGNNAEKVLSKYWNERNKRERPRKELITGVLPNKYQPEPVVKKIAFGGLLLLFRSLSFCTSRIL